ncbi:MAG: LemA family protein [Planctomycetota bacterium]|jgi:LemA protein|nr:LemA family protein [Planctomycetota bacterium]MDA1213415.1 LemA family protein [Planctomycetota bacterium]
MDGLDGPLIVLFAIPVVGLIWFIAGFNALVRIRNHCRESWSNIDTELKRRYDLIPNLVNTVKGYAAHENELFERVTQARNTALTSNGSPASQAADENNLVRGVRQLFAVAESYPDLKASKNFLALQDELSNTEDRIQRARRFYNANVRDLNTRIEVVPSNLIANWFGFQKEEYFEVEDAIVREAPAVSM